MWVNEELSRLITVRDLVHWGAARFDEAGLWFGHGTDNALDEALVLVCHSLHLPVDSCDAWLDRVVTGAERASVAKIIQQRIETRKPAAYLTGEAWFAGLRFHVNEHVLVPRSPFAELILDGFGPWQPTGGVNRVLDLCCGSGCIGIACAAAFPDSEVVLADISEEALKVACSNIEVHGMGERVTAVRSDVFTGLAGQKFDLIVSNPPYVSESEMASLPAEYHCEPRLGLAAGQDGLDIVERIIAEAYQYLNPGGVLIVEVGNSDEQVMSRWPGLPFIWLEFERGGHGVFVLMAEQLPVED